MALDPSNSSSSEQLALKGLSAGGIMFSLVCSYVSTGFRYDILQTARGIFGKFTFSVHVGVANNDELN